MIEFDEVERAVAWLRDNATVAAKARGERLYVEAYLRTVLAQESEKAEGSAVERERLARVSPAYLATLQAYREAVESDETYRFLREAALAKTEVWRTQEATKRAEGKAYT